MARIGTGTDTHTIGSRQPARRGRSTPRRSKDVLALLQEDHKRVQKMFRQFQKMDHTDVDGMSALVETACSELEVHAKLEEELFYPALREAFIGEEEQMEMLEEAQIEHDTAKGLIVSVRALQPGEARYAAAFTVLGEYVKHHIEEEESQVFKQAKKAKLDLQGLGEALKERRQQLMDGQEEDIGDGAAGRRLR